MYVYFFELWFGSDRVVYIDVLPDSIVAGDCIMIDGQYALALGDDVAFSELYTHSYTGPCTIALVTSSLLSERSMSFMHWFVTYRFTSYKNTVPLFLGNSIEQCIKKIPKKSVKKKHDAQSLIIYPTVWTMAQAVSPVGLGAEALMIHGGSSVVQKVKAFRAIKYGLVTTVHATYSQLFQDRANLDTIVLHDQHAWRYKNQQDPRYYVPTVVKKMHAIWGSQCVMEGLSIGISKTE